VAVDVEVHPLALAQEPEQRALERTTGQHVLRPVGVGDQHALTGLRVEHAHDALHGGSRQGFCTLPAFRQAVQTWRRRGAPLTTARTFWTLGFQRRFVRRWEWLSCIPKWGCLPQIWHTDAM